MTTVNTPIRLDKWLWAARFFKTRALSKAAIESGHVRYNGERCKVSKSVAAGALLTIKRGHDEIEVTVLAVSDQRQNAAQAQQLYAETAASLARRQAHQLQRQMATGLVSFDRPDKQQRRALIGFKRSLQ
ncbi:RNA-binding S4 domain-containing protein [Sinimarinibacterium sp. NLF-5-8]|uniref:RNA-binding S4 domain-containing protein n=1 Tax=Sinimarinibacterium sp. NLF-5-8 TaxID=2698684 RepID=UPI00137B9DD8|nr:S4 domain-containing protein [Sinimarinibacterium sp. NLF-5-8]QHS08704.1 RNA-binding protein [Sinimarinibacterium sp. NLF-5-8]